MIPFSMSSFASASVWARLETRSSSTVTGAWFDEFDEITARLERKWLGVIQRGF
jgi:hypothetical protein